MARKKKSLTSQKIFWIFLGLALVVVAALAYFSGSAPQADVLSDTTSTQDSATTNTEQDPAIAQEMQDLARASQLAACQDKKVADTADPSLCAQADANGDGTADKAEVKAEVTAP